MGRCRNSPSKELDLEPIGQNERSVSDRVQGRLTVSCLSYPSVSEKGTHDVSGSPEQHGSCSSGREVSVEEWKIGDSLL